MTVKPYVVVIVDDHELFAQGLALLLSREWGELFTVGGQTTYVEEAAELVARCDADLAIIDLSMPPLGGVAAIRHVRRAIRRPGSWRCREPTTSAWPRRRCAPAPMVLAEDRAAGSVCRPAVDDRGRAAGHRRQAARRFAEQYQ